LDRTVRGLLLLNRSNEAKTKFAAALLIQIAVNALVPPSQVITSKGMDEDDMFCQTQSVLGVETRNGEWQQAKVAIQSKLSQTCLGGQASMHGAPA